MSVSRLLRRSLLTLPIVLLLLLMCGTGVAMAADGSNTYMTQYNDDNYSEGFSSFYPHNCWRSFDMTYYGGDVWEAFVKGDDPGDPDEEIAVYLARNKAGDTPASKPTHYRVVEPGQTWEWSDAHDGRRPNIVRFAVFNDKLFLYIGKKYDDGTGSALWQKQIDPIEDQYVDGTRWNPPGTNIWENRPNDSKNPRVIRGLVVKVMNDTLYILFQYGDTKDLYLITTKDGETFSTSDGSAPQKIHTFTGNDCLLNGDVITRGADGQPMLAFVTKDDAYGGDSTTGICKLWTFDPETNAVNGVATVPGHDPTPGQYRDMTVAAGDVKGCTPYRVTNLQLWGIGWGSSNVYHMQYVFNPAGTGGSFNPAGIVDAGNASSHVEQSNRGYLASCIAPEQVSGSDDLQMYARVWWWGSTDISNAHGRSLKYKMDLLKSAGSTVSNTHDPDYNPAWLLQGVIYGLPPYYPNGVEVGQQLENFYKIEFALSSSSTATNTVTSEKTLSVSYGAEGIFGIPSASMGLSYTNAVQQTSESTAQTTIQTQLAWSPDLMGTQSDIDVGAQAWGIFFVPKITNDEYELKDPDGNALKNPDGSELDLTLYYTYISGGTDLIDTVFDKTGPNELMAPSAQEYWSGIAQYPNSLTYWDPGWSSPLAPPYGTYIYESGTDDYSVADSVWFYKELGSSAKTYRLSQVETALEAQSSTSKIDISGGAFGFKTDMAGSLTIGSSTSTTFGQELGVTYGLPGWNADPEPDYITLMNMDMYLLQARTDKAFWIPAGARGQHPWCLTWHVNHWKSYAATDEHAKEGPASTTLLSMSQGEFADSPILPAGLRKALVAKLQAAKAAVERGNARTVRNLLNATCRQIEAQSGKKIPAVRAERWISILQAIDVDRLMAGK